MLLTSILESLTSTGRRRPRTTLRKRPAPTRLTLETLEDRCLPSFVGPVSYAVGSSPAAVAVGDFNGDGKPDMVTANTNSNTVSVLLSNGDGTFGTAHDLATGNAPVAVAVGDFNRDGKLDLVTANQGTYPNFDSTVSVLLGNGDGTFQAAQNFTVGMAPRSIAVGDFNNDGKLDLATANYGLSSYSYNNYSGGVSVLLGNGDGTFQAAQNIALPENFTQQHATVIAAGEMDNDGKLDLVVGSQEDNPYDYIGEVIVLRGNGDGTFSTASTTNVYGDVGFPLALALGDFNGDGTLDVVTNGTGLAYSPVALMLGNGDDTLRAPTFPPINYLTGNGTGLAVGDFNCDGKLDLATDYYVFQGNGDGTFQAGVSYKGGDGGSVAVGDFNGDRFPDLVATQPSLSTVSVSLNAADWRTSRFTVSGFPSPTTAGAAHSFTVTMLDPYGNVATGYTGTVHFYSSDPLAALPADYTFTTADAGVHTFRATLKTAGTQSISVKDTVTGNITGTEVDITVNPAAASKFILSAPLSVTAGTAFSLTVTVEDAYGNLVTGYIGTVHFKSTDKTATLPTDYTFTAADQGVHTFTGLVLRKKGSQKITITDTHTNSVTGSVIENVL